VVIVPIDCKAVYAADPDNKELVTSVETINYGGRKVPVIIIFKGAYHLRKHFQNDIDGDTLFARSPTGFLNDKLELKYLEHFNRFTKDHTKGVYHMLIFDGHGSHLSQPFIDYCWEHRIQPFQLPPHITHLLQPLDVGVFQALKHSFKKEIRKEIFNGATKISKVNFFAFFQTFHNKVFKNRQIATSVFRKTGLIPLNPTVVLTKMKEYHKILKESRLQTPTPPPRQSSLLLPSSSPAFTTPPPQTPNWNEYSTPLTLRTRKRGFDYVKERNIAAMEGVTPITPSVIRVADKVENASQRSMLAGALATNRIHDLSIAEAARQKRKKASGKIVQKYGEIYGHQARKDIAADEDDEKEVINMREQRLMKPWKVKYKAIMKKFKQDYIEVKLKHIGYNL